MRLEFPWGILFGLVALIPFLLLVYITFRRRYYSALLFSNLPPLLETVRSFSQRYWWKRALPITFDILIILLSSIIISRPHAVMKVPTRGYTLLLVLDVSGSMMARDFKPSRIEAAKNAAKILVRGLKGNPKIGVLVFDSKVEIMALPTEDKATVLKAIDRIKAHYGGTAIGDAIISAVSILSAVDDPMKFIVLLSDGESNVGMSPILAAKEAKKRNVVIYTIGIGTPQGAYIPNIPYPVRLDEATLKKIASITGGEYYYAGNRQQLNNIFAKIRDKVGFRKKYVDISFVIGGIILILMLIKWVILSLIRYSEI